MDKYILIVGGAGYIGSHANLELSKRGYKTVIVDNLSTGHAEFVKWGEFRKGDLSDAAFLRSVFNEFEIETVMHFAAFAYVGESVIEPEKYYLNNVANTLNLLSVMREFSVKNFVFSSTCATYGIPDKNPITETTKQKPINPYGHSKLMLEQVLRDYKEAYGFNYAVLRYFNACGASVTGEIGEWHEPETHLIPLILDAAYDSTKSIKVFGTDYDTEDGTCIRDYIHVTDLADAHILALEYIVKNSKSEIFNLGNGSGFSVSQVITAAEKVTGRNIATEYCDRRAGDPPALIGDATKALKILGWKPNFGTIESIIETAWQWHLKLKEKNNGI